MVLPGEPSEENGVWHRRSGEHDEYGDGETRDRNNNSHTGAGSLSNNGQPIVQTNAMDEVPTRNSQEATENVERVRRSTDMERGTSSHVARKRKSDEISRDHRIDDPSSNRSLSVDTSATNTTTPHDAPGSSPAASPKKMRSPQYSSLSRTRGMSLRSSIFSRNPDRRSQRIESGVEMDAIRDTYSSPGRPRTAKKEDETTITVSLVVPRVSSPERSRVTSRKGLQGVSALPNYQQWVQNKAHRHLPIDKVRGAYGRARKFVLRIQDIPPSKNGRHIPVDPSRKKALVDERTNQSYISNWIKSSKYTLWNFLPRQLFAQFSKLANFYFLFVSILQMIPGLSTTGTYTTIIPLMFFVSISMAKEGYEDLRRHRLDKAENNRAAKVLHAYRPIESGTDSPSDHGPNHWATVKWQALQVGDIVRLVRDDAAPADLVLLDSKGDHNLAYIETMALDGETNLKTKSPSPAVAGTCSSPEAMAALENTEVVVEDPNLDLYNFEGKISVNGAAYAPLTNNEIIYRGSILRNTPEAVGVVIYSGEECKMRMNANKNPRIKAPSLQAIVNKIVIMMVFFVVILALFNTIAYQIWRKDAEVESWYLIDARVPFGQVLTSFIIMFNTMIPLSLYVSLEIIKVAQMFLLSDIDMYDEASNTPFEARTSTINEELGQVSYIFSDKTGTLTENVMRFRKLSVAGTAWLHDADLKNQPMEGVLLHKKRKIRSKGKGPLHRACRKSTSQTAMPDHGAASPRVLRDAAAPRRSTTSWRSAAPNIGQSQLHTNEMIRYIQRHPHTAFAKKASLMLLSMALCHTCLPERAEDGDDISYQAASPDELALVQAARELGYFAFDRLVSTLTLKTYPNGLDAEPVLETYEILEVIEFSSKRKRMSVVVRFPDERICVICKGADSVIMEKLRLATIANQKAAEIDKRINTRRSLEVQQALNRRSSTVERQGSVGQYPRTSMSQARRSMTRSSTGGLSPIRDDIDGWLRERESDGITPADPRHYAPRPSAQIARRSTAANSLHSEMEDEPLVEEALVLDDSAVIERCLQHITDFATEGLRTLLYGHRFLNGEEYRSWKKVHQDATTSLVDREKLIDEAGELIEQQLELCGATAIEDKLQKGVPETIDRLRRANIKMWMLTGDKRETAINIGHSCRLIKDYSSVTVLDYEAGGVEQSIASAIVDINRGSVAHAVVVIDGRTFGMIQAEDSLNTLFLDLAIMADSVICCRASPSQKATLVHAIRRHVNRSVTLAIGDGANDIAMIQEAHVGIGITGKEGLQAARVSDYSIAQFRFLNKLLLVHGRWNYIRTAKYTVGTFWKEMLFYLTQALYQRWAGYTGTSLYEQWSLSMFNTLFTSLPVIFLGIFEKDLHVSTLIAVPELYTKGQRFAAFNFKVYLSWIFMAASEAMVLYFIMYSLYGRALFTRGQDLFSMGDMTFTACIITINIKLQVVEQHNRSIMALICVVIEIGGWFLWNIILGAIYKDNQEYDVKGGFLERFGRNPLWWLPLILAVTSCILFEICVRTLKNVFFPTDVEVFQELEKDIHVRRRFEEASASELQAGWHHGTKKSSLELHREAEEQAERENEVQDMLARPRVMEEGRKGSAVETAEQLVMVDEDRSIRRSSEVQELSRRFGSIKY